ncbi:Zinc finger HIT-type [Penicillium sp. DV-2018c]|nr:Zinc finger HIT-type [Penicillium sp. DV-2018c]KAJ5561098.1 Zinc finger HIT-type [Penicillium sp. DV-2018c]
MADSEALLSDLCSICHVNPPKYRCPRCSTRTCSLPCTRRHKLWSECSGVRDPAAYLKRKELTESAFDRDFNFITGIERSLERAEREVDNRGIDLSGGAQTDDTNAQAGRKRKHPNQGLAKGEAALLRGAEAARVTILRAPKGMSRNKQNGSRMHPKHKRLAWTIEWISGDGEKIIGDSVLDTCSIAEAYNRSHPRPKDQESLVESTKQEDKNEDLSTPNNDTGGTSTAAQGGSNTTESEAPVESSQPPSTQDTTEKPVQASVVEAEKTQTDAVSAHRGLYFYLHRPRTTTKKPVLAPISKSATLHTILQDRTVLEFPTIYALPESAETLFADKDVSKFIDEEEYLRTIGPEETGPSSLPSDEDNAVENGALLGASAALENLDEKRVLEVLKQDLFEPAENEPGV